MGEIENTQHYAEHRDITVHVGTIIQHVQGALGKSALISHWLSEERYNLRTVGEQVRLLQESLAISRKSLFEVKCFDDVNQTYESRFLHGIAQNGVAIIGKQAGDCEKALMKAAREELVGPVDPDAPVKPEMTDWERRQVEGMRDASS